MSRDDTAVLKDSIYRSADLRERVAREIGKRPDVALNQVMLILAELYADGVRDGDGFGMRSVAAQVRASSASGVPPGSSETEDAYVLRRLAATALSLPVGAPPLTGPERDTLAAEFRREYREARDAQE